jgi:hypothetical protein
MTIGKCDCCWSPGSDETEVYTSTYDAGFGDMRTQQLCAACGGVALAINEVAGHLAILGFGTNIGDKSGENIPASFFDTTSGKLMPPPWTYGEARISVHLEHAIKRASIVVPVSCIASLSFAEMNKLVELTAVLAALFAKSAPAGWTVHS